MKIDFLCVGYPKCGTTTLHAILKQYKQIKLPTIKEPHFFRWKDRYENPVGKLYSEYYIESSEQDRQIVGMVDPTLNRLSIEELNKYFGNHTKIIIMLRNPVKALFSEFRMGLKIGYYWMFYSPIGKSSVEKMFERYLEQVMSQQFNYGAIEYFRYEKYLQSLLTHKDKKDVKIIVFEEFIKNPTAYKADLEEFLGIDSEVVDYNIWINEGREISRNYFCARLNNVIHKTAENSNKNVKRIGLKLKEISKFTRVINTEKISPEAERKCEDIYRSSKNRVAELIGKDLDKLWFQ